MSCLVQNCHCVFISDFQTCWNIKQYILSTRFVPLDYPTCWNSWLGYLGWFSNRSTTRKRESYIVWLPFPDSRWNHVFSTSTPGTWHAKPSSCHNWCSTGSISCLHTGFQGKFHAHFNLDNYFDTLPLPNSRPAFLLNKLNARANMTHLKERLVIASLYEPLVVKLLAANNPPFMCYVCLSKMATSCNIQYMWYITWYMYTMLGLPQYCSCTSPQESIRCVQSHLLWARGRCYDTFWKHQRMEQRRVSADPQP